MQAWRNGRRACLRGMFERVWVQVPPPAPLAKTAFLLVFAFFEKAKTAL